MQNPSLRLSREGGSSATEEPQGLGFRVQGLGFRGLGFSSGASKLNFRSACT